VAQLQRTRSLAARPPRCEDDESFQWRQPALVQTEETLHARLLEQFEAGLEEAERRRVALHDEIAGLRHRKQTALSELRAAVRSKYEAALQAGRVPAITTAKSGACCGCAARLPPPVVEAVGRGAVMVCPGCDRLLCPSP
jgi:predicted  nucleic acid-binding Zn-ribbon protein